MSPRRRSFGGWFAALLTFFLLANLAGAVRPMGLKSFRLAGFPFTITARGFGSEEAFDWSALGLNLAIAVGIAAAVAWICARSRVVPRGDGGGPAAPDPGVERDAPTSDPDRP